MSEVLKEGVLGVLLSLSTFQRNLWVDRSLTFGIHRWMQFFPPEFCRAS